MLQLVGAVAGDVATGRALLCRVAEPLGGMLMPLPLLVQHMSERDLRLPGCGVSLLRALVPMGALLPQLRWWQHLPAPQLPGERRGRALWCHRHRRDGRMQHAALPW